MGHFCNFQSKQSPNRRKFAKSGHPAYELPTAGANLINKQESYPKLAKPFSYYTYEIKAQFFLIVIETGFRFHPTGIILILTGLLKTQTSRRELANDVS
jgi:hypothetical protein